MGTVNYKGSEIRATSKLGLAGVDINSWDDVRGNNNLIIDPCFIHWPEGSALRAVADAKYGPALWKWSQSVGGVDIGRSTDVPIGSKVPYSMQVDVTTANADPLVAADVNSIHYHVTGFDLAPLWGKTVAFAFWVKSPKTGTHYVSFQNADRTRSFVREFTVVAANTWEKKTVTVTLNEATGTWLFDEGIGLFIGITLAAGSNFTGAKDAWNSADDRAATGATLNVMDNIANNFLIHAPQLNVGSAALPFTAPPAAQAQRQVEYYVEELVNGADSNPEHLAVGECIGTTNCYAVIRWKIKRAVPSAPTISAAGDFGVWDLAGTTKAVTGITQHERTTRSGMMQFTVASGLAGGDAGAVRGRNANARMLIDSRH